MLSAAAETLMFPAWSAPAQVCVTMAGDRSVPAPYGGFNLALHVGDDPMQVQSNRQQLITALDQPAIQWMNQTHSTDVVELSEALATVDADAIITRCRNLPLAVLTADCLPILLCDQQGQCVAAIHAGWRGLAAGIIANTVAAMALPGDRLLAYLGPAISQSCYEVGVEVRQQFLQLPGADHQVRQAFIPSSRQGHYLADLYQLARWQLRQLNIIQIVGGDLCTYRDPRFYSYRRQSQTGRFACLISLT